MPSFDMRYEEDEDVLEIVFAIFDERFTRTLALNDHIFVYTDPGLGAVWALTFYSFARLLGVSETEFSALKELEDEQIEAVLKLLSRPPASAFFDITDPQALVARVLAPRIDALVLGPE